MGLFGSNATADIKATPIKSESCPVAAVIPTMGSPQALPGPSREHSGGQQGRRLPDVRPFKM